MLPERLPGTNCASAALVITCRGWAPSVQSACVRRSREWTGEIWKRGGVVGLLSERHCASTDEQALCSDSHRYLAAVYAGPGGSAVPFAAGAVADTDS